MSDEAESEAHVRVEPIPAGSRWREMTTGRTIRVLSSEVYGTGPAWEYEDEPPGSHNWWYCDAWDFLVWGRFVRVYP